MSLKLLFQVNPALPNKPTTSNCRYSGQSIVEVSVGMIFLVALALAILDLSVLSLAGITVGNSASQAARAAAQASSLGNAQSVISNPNQFFPANTTLYQNPQLTINAPNGWIFGDQVTVIATVGIKLPVPVPLLMSGQVYNLVTQASKPIVGTPPSLNIVGANPAGGINGGGINGGIANGAGINGGGVNGGGVNGGGVNGNGRNGGAPNGNATPAWRGRGR